VKKSIYFTLGCTAAATLAFQVVLTRLFALAQGHHFTFMAVSLALLGAGASGTYLSLRPPSPERRQRSLAGAAALFALATPAAYLAVNYLPFDAYRLAWEPVQLLWLMAYYLALTVPFFCSGLVGGAALAAWPGRAGPLYAASLLGSGLGPLLALAALATVGGPGTVFLASLLGWLGAIAALTPSSGIVVDARGAAALVIALALVGVATITLAVRPPALFDVQLGPYKSLYQALLYPGSQVVFQQWNAASRVDVVRSQGIRSAPGLSLAYRGGLPPQLGLLVDGDNLSPISRPPAQAQADRSFTAYLPLALGFRLRPAARVLILEPGGGLAVLAALQAGARAVTVVQSNPTVVEVVGRRFAEFDGALYADPRVTVVVEEPRSFLRRNRTQFDLILLPLTDSFRPVTAGAYTLSEDYRYTVEALADALADLSPGGLLLAERWLQMPPSESLRLWSTAIAAVEGAAPGQPAGPRLLALRTLQTSLVGVAQAPLSAGDLAAIREYADQEQYDLIWLPGLRSEETNHFSRVPGDPYYQTFAGLLTAPDRAAFMAAYPYAITPPTDNTPFFFHFFRWQQTPQIVAMLGKSWQPFGGSGYLVLVVLLALVVILSAGLIVLPLLVRPGNLPAGQTAALLYFALLGLGFLFVEIPLLQRFILYLGQPAYSFGVVVAALLAASGLGSRYLSARLPLRLALPLIAGLVVVYPWLLTGLFDLTLRLPFAGRVAITIIAILPLGALLGVPFPAGLARLDSSRPGLIPWVWAVNGCASVISAVLAAMIALTWGLAVVLWAAAAAYGLAGVVVMSHNSGAGGVA
jgi:hypothetical protein